MRVFIAAALFSIGLAIIALSPIGDMTLPEIWEGITNE